VVLGEEAQPAYDRVHLTDLLRGRSIDDLTLGGSGWYARHGIELRTGDPVIFIDREEHTVTLKSGHVMKYGRLVLATGSRPYVPPIEGADLPKVFVYRTIDDLTAIQNQALRSRTAAVIGGGLLGLEAARALQTLGAACAVVEYAPHLMPAQLDGDGAALLRSQIEKLGIRVHTGARTERIESTDGGLRLWLAGGSEQVLRADMVVIAAGIRPRHELGEAAGLTIAARGGVLVDNRLRTSDPAIHAIGECASHRGVSYGLVAPGYRMAEVLAGNLMGRDSEFDGADLSTRLKVLGVDVTVLGDYAQPDATTTWRSGDSYRVLVTKGGRLAGASGVGPWPEAGEIQDGVLCARRVWPWHAARFRRHGSPWPARQRDARSWPANATVCNCMSVSRGALTQARENGCTTIEALAQTTGASTLCGSCKPLLAQLLGASGAGAAPSRGGRGLAATAVAAAVLCLLLALSSPIPYSETVQQRIPVDELWRNGILKQVSGFTLLSLTLLGLLMSLRKRWKRFSRGNFGYWRVLHAATGALALIILVAHTGMRFGSNLNFALMTFFVAANFVGAAAGAVTGMEQRFSGPAGMKYRRWLTWAHIVTTWPLPVLAGFHVFSVYYF
jgi:nitrite reductase (NADH) large subunit